MKQLKPRWLAITLFVLSLLYLIPEVIFNARLVEVAGGDGLSNESLHLAELFGRSISGIGVTLLLIDLIVVRRLAQRFWIALPAMIAIALVVWPTVFFGQKWIVDRFIVEPSTADQRKDAFFSTVLRSSLAHNALKIEGIPYDSEHATSPSEMTFLALMGGLIYSNDAFLEAVDNQKKPIVERYLINRAGGQFDQHYAKYSDMRQQVRASWDQYHKASRDYQNAMNSRTREANEAWSKVETQILKGWKDYQGAEKAFFARAEAKSQNLAPKISGYFDEQNRCIKRYGDGSAERYNRCIENNLSDYKSTLRKYGLPYKEMDYWLIKEKSRVKGTTTLKETVMSLGISAILAGLEIATGDAGEQTEKWVYSSSVSNYTPKVLLLMQPEFKRETGYPMGIATLSDFRKNPTTTAKIKHRVQQEGLTLPKNWSVAQITVFKNAVKAKIVSETKRRWADAMAKRDLDMKPGLTFDQFQRHADIQAHIKRQMGERFYVNPMLATWNNKQFYDHVIMVNVKRERDYWLNYMESAESQFENGAPLAEDGKNALRSIIVPPISMSLSLFLVLVTFVKLPFKFWKLLSYNDEVIDNANQSKTHKWIESGLGIAVIALIFILPLSLGKSKFTDDNSTTGYFLKQIDEMVSPAGSTLLTWVLHAQPAIQPVGFAFENNFQLFELFEQTAMTPINEMDKAVYAKIAPTSAGSIDPDQRQALEEQRKAIAESGALAELPFTIQTNVQDAKIRVLNIKPVYRAGMPLPVGNYHVEISAPGYQTVKKWIAHSKKQSTHQLNLIQS
ncbi:hypothetical protein [Photobacterium nomapromontoriensis]|uniref:hypothetical protein n=1 Tax=Photobacterium nomapromontoriensis TaxID=2910237 RepID=UPI003D136AB3